MNMDNLILDDIAHSIVKIRMFPYFDIAHYILMSTAVRDDTPQSGSASFSRKHPFACWFATMLMCFGGSILSSFVMGEPVFKCFDDHRAVLTASLVWYLVNYSPFDIVYNFCRVFGIRLFICALKEFQRAKKISAGINHAYEKYPESVVTCLLAGLLKGSGYLEMKIFTRLVRGVWLPASTEFLHPSFTTKISLMTSILFYCEQLNLVPLSSNMTFLIAAGVLIYMRVAMLLLGVKDPLSPIQNLTCTIFFGGFVDALKTAFSNRSETAISNNQQVSGGSIQSNLMSVNNGQGGLTSKVYPDGESVKISSKEEAHKRSNSQTPQDKKHN